MCFSAIVKHDLKELAAKYHARVDLTAFEDLFNRRSKGEKLSLTRGMELNFIQPKTMLDRKIKADIEKHEESQIKKITDDLKKQNSRLKVASEKLKEKKTKTAENEVAVSERQIARLTSRLNRLKSPRSFEKDSRVYAFDWALVLIIRDGERVIVPMRYHLRPPGVQPDFDRKYPGCYNARMDSLTGFWKKQFGKNHAILIITSFFENVKKHDYEKRKLKKGEVEENIVLQFKPGKFQEMLVPCIWDHWEMKGEPSIDGFALITDDPPDEIAETGHNRCPIFLQEEYLDQWLNPKNQTQDALLKLLNHRETPKYSHSLAA